MNSVAVATSPAAVVASGAAKKMTTVAKQTLREIPVPYSGTPVQIDNDGEIIETLLGQLCWNVCVNQHHRRVEGRKEGRRKRGQDPNPSQNH